MSTRLDLDGGAVAFLEASHAVPLVSIVIALRTGSAHDPVGKEGLARIVARMLRRGCEGLGAHEIEDTIDRLGGEMSVDTGFSSLSIHAQFIGRNLGPFIELLARLLATPTFPEEEFERLRRETIAEIIESRDHDRLLAQRAFGRAVFRGHPYARSATGTIASLQSLTREDLIAFYRRHFTQRNLIIGFAGDVTAEAAPVLARTLVEKLPAGEPIEDHVPVPQPTSGRRLTFVDKPERTQTQILMGALGTWPHDPDHWALSVANAIFGGTFTSRLMKEVRSKRGWSYGATSRLTIERQRHAFSMWTFPASGDAAPCVKLELELLDQFVAEGVTARELKFIQQYLMRSHAFDVDTAPKRLHQALDVELLGLPPDYYSAYVDHIRAVTVEQANLAVKERLHPSDLRIVVVGTATSILDQIKAAIIPLASWDVVAFDAE